MTPFHTHPRKVSSVVADSFSFATLPASFVAPDVSEVGEVAGVAEGGTEVEVVLLGRVGVSDGLGVGVPVLREGWGVEVGEAFSA